jgi:hypothetical protein
VGVLLASLAALPASAQQTTGNIMRDTSGTKRDPGGAKAPAAHGAATDSALVELGRAIAALAVSVQTVVAETANNPEVRRAAVETAGSAVSVAQRALKENTGEIERLLEEASRRLADAAATQKAKSDAKAKSRSTTPSKP